MPTFAEVEIGVERRTAIRLRIQDRAIAGTVTEADMDAAARRAI